MHGGLRHSMHQWLYRCPPELHLTCLGRLPPSALQALRPWPTTDESWSGIRGSGVAEDQPQGGHRPAATVKRREDGSRHTSIDSPPPAAGQDRSGDGPPARAGPRPVGWKPSRVSFRGCHRAGGGPSLPPFPGAPMPSPADLHPATASAQLDLQLGAAGDQEAEGLTAGLHKAAEG